MKYSVAFGLAVAISLIFESKCFGTAQQPEKLIINGKTEALFSEPLREYLSSLDVEEIEFLQEGSRSTANYRGYIATWEIKNAELLLVKIEKKFRLSDESRIEEQVKALVDANYDPVEYEWKEVEIERLFPKGTKLPIRADWFTGKLISPQRKRTKRIHARYASDYEIEHIFRVEKAKVVAEDKIRIADTPFESRWDLRRRATFEPVKNKSEWIDLRWLLAGSQKEAPQKDAFTTRGDIYFLNESNTHTLQIPETQKTEYISIPVKLTKTQVNKLEKIPGDKPSEWKWIEITGKITNTEKSEGLILTAKSIRQLESGESIHHPNFPQQFENLNKAAN